MKKLESNRYQSLSSMITFDEEVTISNVSDLTKEISFYEYGPLLTIYELEDFCKKIIQKQSALKEHYQELFFYLYCIICQTPKTAIDTSVLAFKYPFCFMLKFGNIEEIKYVMHFDNGVYYNLDKKASVQYQESYYLKARESWLTIMREREREFIQIQDFHFNKKISELVQNQNGLVNEISNFKDNIEKSLEETEKKLDQLSEQDEKIRGLMKRRDTQMGRLAQAFKTESPTTDRNNTKTNLNFT